MGSWPRSLSLGHRIVGTVALGTVAMLLLSTALVLWTIEESAAAAYGERVTLARTLEARVGDVLTYSLRTLEREAGSLTIESGSKVGRAQIRQLADLRRRLGSFAILSVTDELGTTVWTDPPRADIEIGAPLSHPAVPAALRTGEPQIVELQAPTERATVYACLAVPLRDVDGRIAGVLMAELDPNHPTLNLLPTGTVGDGILVQLMNGSGQVIAGTADFSPKAALEHQTLLADLIALKRPGYRIHETPPGSGAPAHIVAYAPVAHLPSWGVVLEQSRDVVLATPDRLRQRLAFFGLAALAFAVAAAWLDARRVVRPLQHLTATAERFAAGKLEEPVCLDRTDELGILARAFDTMRQRLRSSLSEVAAWNRELELRVAARTGELERRNRDLAHVNAIAMAVSESLDSKLMLERTLNHVLEITGADAGCFWITNGVKLELSAQRGWSAAMPQEHSYSGECLCWRAARLGQVVAASSDPLGPGSIDCRLPGLQAALAVPVPAGERMQAALFLVSSQADRFRQTDLTTLAAIGRQVGIALANARLYHRLEVRERERAELLQRLIAGQEEERRRLAQELHDDASQALASLQIGLERLATGSYDREHSREIAGQLRGVAGETLAQLHRLAVELRPSVLDDIGMIAAIERYLQDCAQQWHLAVDFATVNTDGFRLMPAVETTVYRIVQAALTNVAHHAQAKHVSVLLERRDEKLVAVVEDDGRGFDLPTVRAGPLESRLGLAGMEERAALIGALLTIETAPGAGTTLFLELPLDARGGKEAGSG